MSATAPSESIHRDPWAPPRQWVARELSVRLAHRGLTLDPAAIEGELASPPEGMGDLALPLFRWAKQAKTDPNTLATALAEGFPLGEYLAGVEASRGFLNFRLQPEWLAAATLRSVLVLAQEYGRSPPNQRRVCVEHTSTNPTGLLHVGRSRNGIVGDTYVRALRAAGYDVTAQFYVDDIGRQAATLVWIWSKPIDQWPEEVRSRAGLSAGAVAPEGMKSDAWLGKPYPGASELVAQDAAAAQEVSQLVARFERGEIPADEYRRVPREVLEGTKATLARVGIRFDEFVWESEFVLDGSVSKVLELFAASPHARREEGGALAVDASGWDLPKKEAVILLTRSDGSSLYVVRDVAYHLQKLARFERVIDVLGEDHKLHFRTLSALLEMAGVARKPELFTYSFVSLPEGKMSTRAGRVVTLDDLLEEAHVRALEEVRKRRPDLDAAEAERIAESVGTGAVRYHLLAIQPDKPITFRWEEALSFEGRSAPFVQYAHARAASLLRRAQESNPAELAHALAERPGLFPLPGTMEDRELALLKTLSRFPSLVARVAETGAVHLLALYPHEVAERLNEYYQAVRVLGGEPNWLPFRLALIAAARQVLRNSLELIAIEPLDRM